MKIKFLGAVGGDVTGSCILCCARNGTRFLVDCGAFQGGGFTDSKNARFGFDPRTIDFVLLTHAHHDHCGRLPALYDCGFRGQIYCNNVTRDLTIINLLDGMKDRFRMECPMEDPEDRKDWLRERRLQEQDYWMGRFETEDDRPEIANQGITFLVDNDLKIGFRRSSHFLGSCGIRVEWNSFKAEQGTGRWLTKSILFSGDIGSAIDIPDAENHLPLLKDGFVPDPHTDYIVMESTYGIREREPQHGDFQARIAALSDIILSRQYTTSVFACFSMQRTQDVLFDVLYAALESGESFSIILDSPMAMDACRAFAGVDALLKTKTDKDGTEKFSYLSSAFWERFRPLVAEHVADIDSDIEKIRKFIKGVLSFNFNTSNVEIISGDDDASDDDFVRRRIYITSSGMYQHGPILSHLWERHDSDKTAFVVTGYCQSTDNGRIISRWSEGGVRNGVLYGGFDAEEERERWIHGADMEAGIRNVAPYYSGHADVRGLMRFLFESARLVHNHPNKRDVTVFLNHGDAIARAELKEKIQQENKNKGHVRSIKQVILPRATDGFFDLDAGEWDSSSHGAEEFTMIRSISEDLSPPHPPRPRKSKLAKQQGKKDAEEYVPLDIGPVSVEMFAPSLRACFDIRVSADELKETIVQLGLKKRMSKNKLVVDDKMLYQLLEHYKAQQTADGRAPSKALERALDNLSRHPAIAKKQAAGGSAPSKAGEKKPAAASSSEKKAGGGVQTPRNRKMGKIDVTERKRGPLNRPSLADLRARKSDAGATPAASHEKNADGE